MRDATSLIFFPLMLLLLLLFIISLLEQYQFLLSLLPIIHKRIITLKNTKKFLNKVRKLRPLQPRIRRPPLQQLPRNRIPFTHSNSQIYARTGLFEDKFFHYYDAIKTKLMQPRQSILQKRSSFVYKTSLQPCVRLLLVLQFLRHHQSYSILSLEWGISRAQISREIHHILPILCASMNEMPRTLPTAPQQYRFEGVIGAIDCTAHYCW